MPSPAIRLIPAALALLFAAGLTIAQDKPAAKPPAGGAVATVNGAAIPQSRLELFVRQAIAQGQADSPELRNAVKQELIAREIVVQEALKKGLDKSPDFTAQLDMLRQQLLLQLYQQDFPRTHQPAAAAMRGEYDKLKAQQGDKEYRARHILVKTEEEAKEVLGQLSKGGKFEQIASEKSLDTGSKASGGDLNWAAPGNYVKPFSDALTKLKKGETTRTPVQTQFGWHVIQLTDERALKMPSYDELKPRIAQAMTQQSLQKAIQDLRTKAKIVE